MIGTRDKTNTPWGPRPLPKKGPSGPSLGVGPKSGKAGGGTNGIGPHTGGPEPF